ncbi:MAG: hypothetical protein Kow0042_18960 [Calditrichia bacterium]
MKQSSPQQADGDKQSDKWFAHFVVSFQKNELNLENNLINPRDQFQSDYENDSEASCGFLNGYIRAVGQ